MDKSTETLPSLERIGLLSGLIGAFGVIISFVYDWGFFSALGISFTDAPTTLSDHFRTWLVWMSRIAAALVAGFGLRLLTVRIERGMTEEEIIESSSNPTLVRRFRNSPPYVMAVVGLLITVPWILFGETFFDGLLIGLAIWWCIFVVWAFDHPTVQQRTVWWVRLMYFVPAAALVIFFMGSSTSKRTHATYTIHTTSSVQNVEILRVFERWLLVRKDHQISWIPLSDINRMKLVRTPKSFVGFACLISERWCSTNPDTHHDQTRPE